MPIWCSDVVWTVGKCNWAKVSLYTVYRNFGGQTHWTKQQFLNSAWINIYTQSQKKHTMSSLASHVTQGQGLVTPAGSYFITRIWNRLQKTSQFSKFANEKVRRNIFWGVYSYSWPSDFNVFGFQENWLPPHPTMPAGTENSNVKPV